MAKDKRHFIRGYLTEPYAHYSLSVQGMATVNINEIESYTISPLPPVTTPSPNSPELVVTSILVHMRMRSGVSFIIKLHKEQIDFLDSFCFSGTP